MKHTMTPRVPQLHNRTLSGNIFDQSLGVLHDSVLDGNGIATELLDSEHAHLQIIGKEVSISQEESENFLSEDQRYSSQQQQQQQQQHDGSVEDSDSRLDALNCSPEKFSCSDDTPGIGMEVVCTEVPDSSVTFATTSHHLHEAEANNMVSSHNGMVNGFGGVSPPLPPSPSPPHGTHPLIDNIHLSPTKGAEATTKRGTESDLADVELKYSKLLQQCQDSRYDLRFVQRYQANTKSSSSNSSTTHTPVTHTSSTRKRGRPRKYPLQQTPTSS